MSSYIDHSPDEKQGVEIKTQNKVWPRQTSDMQQIAATSVRVQMYDKD